MAEVATGARPLAAAGAARLARAAAMRRPPAAFDRQETERRFDRLIGEHI
jgi:hypothetical protein